LHSYHLFKPKIESKSRQTSLFLTLFFVVVQIAHKLAFVVILLFKFVIKDYSGIVSIALLFTLIIVVSPLASAQTTTDPTSINISTCQTLNIPGATYVLTSDITTTEDCFKITADGITLDGNGHKLIGDASGELGDRSGDFGIHIISSNGVTIQNIDLSYFMHGIEIESSDETTVKNNYIHNINKYGVQLDGDSSNYNLVYNNYFYQSQN